MPGFKPLFRTVPDAGVVEVGAPVSQSTWRSAARSLDWINGSKRVQAPACLQGFGIQTNTTVALEYRHQQHQRAIERKWVIVAESLGLPAEAQTGATVNLVVKAPSTATAGDEVRYFPSDDRDNIRPFVYTETLTAQTAATVTPTISLEAENGGVYIASVACYEQERPVLATGGPDYGIESGSITARAPIRDVVGQSTRGVVDAYENADPRPARLRGRCRRARRCRRRRAHTSTSSRWT